MSLSSIAGIPEGLPKSAGHPFYRKLNELLAEARFMLVLSAGEVQLAEEYGAATITGNLTGLDTGETYYVHQLTQSDLAATGNRISEAAERLVYLTGFILLMVLLAWVTLFDTGILQRQGL